MAEQQATEDRVIVLVTGAGRSGTSTVAGALHHLGFHVPMPVLKANESNPKGFFESRWSVRFHRRLMDRALIEQTDGRPAAAELMLRTVDDDARARLRKWLTKQLHISPSVMVKDPRASWVSDLWAQTADDLDARLGFVTMYRHPAEVVRSRQTHYLSGRPHMDAYGFAVMGLAGWVNSHLVTERSTRGRPRVLVSYDRLRSDWRSEMTEVRDRLGLALNHPLTDAPHPDVDGFIEPGLNRHEGSWDGLDLPPELVEIATDVHHAMEQLAARGQHDAEVEGVFDGLSARYADLYRRSQAISVDAATARARAARARGVEEGRVAQQAQPAAEQVSPGRGGSWRARWRARH